MLKSPQAGITFLAGILLAACDPIVNRFAFHPDNTHVVAKDALPEDMQEISLITHDGVTLTSLYLPASGASKILLFFHGNAGNIYHRISSLVQLRQFGINVLGVSYRGYGKSQGSPSENGLYLDGEAALDYAKALGFKENNIIVFGRSIGSTVATHVAKKNLAGLVLITPLSNGREMANSGGLGMFAWLVGDSFDNLSRIKHIQSPLLIIHGTDDHIVPFQMGVTLYEKADTQKQFVAIENGRHNNLEQRFAAQYWSEIEKFINTLD